MILNGDYDVLNNVLSYIKTSIIKLCLQGKHLVIVGMYYVALCTV